MYLVKYIALGNDYWVLNPNKTNRSSDFGTKYTQDVFRKNFQESTSKRDPLTPQFVQFLCDRHKGLGADGVLCGPHYLETDSFGVEVWNADGSRAETSGNGMTIFAQYLADTYPEQAFNKPITLIPSPQCKVRAHVNSTAVSIDLGTAIVGPAQSYELPEEFYAGFHLAPILTFYPVHIGNPHCVVPLEQDPTAALAKSLGPLLEKHPYFSKGTNVQFVHYNKNNEAYIEIWERGSGYTLGSGSSSCAVASVYGQIFNQTNYSVALTMPGGTIRIHCKNGRCTFENYAFKVAEIELFDN